ncbi:MAG: hypothetical protein HY796_06270 [Elusimicrobia bacterium]|nr:hypothetical protein [Elusimicrobiota bacterium]
MHQLLTLIPRLNDKELVRLLTHLGLPAEFPKFKPAPQALLYEHACDPPVCVRSLACAWRASRRTGRPAEDSQLDPRVDCDAIEPAPADD